MIYVREVVVVLLVLCAVANFSLDILRILKTQVRSDPAEHVRNAVDQVKAARALTKDYHDEQVEKMSTRQDLSKST